MGLAQEQRYMCLLIVHLARKMIGVFRLQNKILILVWLPQVLRLLCEVPADFFN